VGGAGRIQTYGMCVNVSGYIHRRGFIYRMTPTSSMTRQSPGKIGGRNASPCAFYAVLRMKQ
jgi:hypothetical protein